MANTKISQLADGAPAQPTDLIPVARGGTNVSLKVSDLSPAGQVTKTVRSIATSFTQGGVVGPIVMTFSPPFADNNYTIQVTVLGDEVAPGTPTVTQFPSVGVSYIAFQVTPGAGVNVWVANNDSISHTGVVHVTAIHD